MKYSSHAYLQSKLQNCFLVLKTTDNLHPPAGSSSSPKPSLDPTGALATHLQQVGVDENVALLVQANPNTRQLSFPKNYCADNVSGPTTRTKKTTKNSCKTAAINM